MVSAKSAEAAQAGPAWERTIRSSMAPSAAARRRSGEIGSEAKVNNRPYASVRTGRRSLAIRLGWGAAIAITERIKSGYITAVLKASTPP